MLSPLISREIDTFKDINQEEKQRTDTKNEAKKIKSNNFITLGNIEKINNLIAPKLFCFWMDQ